MCEIMWRPEAATGCHWATSLTTLPLLNRASPLAQSLPILDSLASQSALGTPLSISQVLGFQVSTVIAQLFQGFWGPELWSSHLCD